MEKYLSSPITGKAMIWTELANVWTQDWKSHMKVLDQGCKQIQGILGCCSSPKEAFSENTVGFPQHPK